MPHKGSTRRQPEVDRLTARARTYMGVVAVRNASLGVLCMLAPAEFTSHSFDGVKEALWWWSPDVALQAYGVVFAISGLLAALPAITSRERHARTALFLSVSLFGLWVGGFITSALGGRLTAPSTPVIWGSIVALDLTMLRDPLYNPFERVLRGVLAERERR